LTPSLHSLRRLPPKCLRHSHVHVRATNLGNVLRNSSFVSFEVLDELLGEALSSSLVLLAIWPAVNGAQDLWVDTLHFAGHLQVEAAHRVEVGHVQGIVMDGVDDGSRLGQGHAMADTVTATHPAGVDQPDLSLVLLTLLSEHLSVDVGMQGQESFSEAGGESHLRLGDADLSSSDLGGVARNEMVHSLLRVQLRDGGHDTEGIASEEDDVLGVTTNSWKLNITDVLERVAHTSVRGEADVVVVNDSCLAFSLMVTSVLNDCAKFNSVKNIGLSCTRKTVGFGVTATLNVEHILVGPDVLIVTNQQALRVRRKSRLACARETEKDGGVTIRTNVGRAMHAESSTLGHIVVHDAEDTLLHLACIGSAKNDELFGGEVDAD